MDLFIFFGGEGGGDDCVDETEALGFCFWFWFWFWSCLCLCLCLCSCSWYIVIVGARVNSHSNRASVFFVLGVYGRLFLEALFFRRLVYGHAGIWGVRWMTGGWWQMVCRVECRKGTGAGEASLLSFVLR
ncbi:hypothetical protein BDZ94DRAFT_767935 [Collybia nuda]|uniref:Transmembrane protein n=1 Tax=Collybia nuda TaxID=64659 RepID=A0A9P5Y439_9AGAR|nr:hypothetical protein BDZ94DRAFT_767935 [Collybia nuda]